MRIEVEIPDNYAELLKAVALLLREDPEAYLRSKVARYVVDSIKACMNTLGENAFFDSDQLAEKYGLTDASSMMKVEVRVPKPIVDFLKDLGVDFETILQDDVVDWFGSQLQVSYEDPGIFGCPRSLDVRPLIEKHRLREVPGLESSIEKD